MAYRYNWRILVFHHVVSSFPCYKYFEEEKIFGHREPFRNRCFLFGILGIIGCFWDIIWHSLTDIEITSDNTVEKTALRFVQIRLHRTSFTPNTLFEIRHGRDFIEKALL